MRGCRISLVRQPLILCVIFDALVAEEGVFRPLAVDFDKARQLFVVRADRVDDFQAFAVDFQSRRLHERLVVLADKVGEADGVGLAVIHGEIAVGNVAEFMLFRDHRGNRVFRQLNCHIVQPRLKNKNLLLERIEVGGKALADTLQITVIVLERPVLQLKAVDFGNQVYHEAVLHIVIQERIGVASLITAARTGIAEQLARQQIVAKARVVGRVDADIQVRRAGVGAFRTAYFF